MGFFEIRLNKSIVKEHALFFFLYRSLVFFSITRPPRRWKCPRYSEFLATHLKTIRNARFSFLPRNKLSLKKKRKTHRNTALSMIFISKPNGNSDHTDLARGTRVRQPSTVTDKCPARRPRCPRVSVVCASVCWTSSLKLNHSRGTWIAAVDRTRISSGWGDFVSVRRRCCNCRTDTWCRSVAS